MFAIIRHEFRSAWFEFSFLWKDLIEYLHNTWTIIWIDLWIRQNEFHWTNDSHGYLYRNSFFSGLLRERFVVEVDFDSSLHYSLYTSKLLARREIAHRIDDEKRPYGTFFLRQWAWFKYLRNI